MATADAVSQTSATLRAYHGKTDMPAFGVVENLVEEEVCRLYSIFSICIQGCNNVLIFLKTMSRVDYLGSENVVHCSCYRVIIYNGDQGLHFSLICT